MARNQVFRFVLAVFMSAAAAVGSPFSAVVAYGDSLSENGNLFAAVGQPGLPTMLGGPQTDPLLLSISRAFSEIRCLILPGPERQRGSVTTSIPAEPRPQSAPLGCRE